MAAMLTDDVIWHVPGHSARTRRAMDQGAREDYGLIVSSTLTLLALLIGFSFSMATTRYDLRKNYEEAEANAIGTEYVRAGLLPSDDAKTVRSLLGDYLDQRISFYRSRDALQLRQIDSPYRATAERSVVRGPGAGHCAADSRPRPGRFGHERRVELAGIHTGRLVESDPTGGVGADGDTRHLLQSVGWIWGANHQQVWLASGSAADCVPRVLAGSGH